MAESGDPSEQVDSSPVDPSNPDATTDEKVEDVTIQNEILIRTTIRQAVLPYLPPPLVRTIRHVDPLLAPHVGEEPSITILGSLLVAYFLYQAIRLVTFGSRKAIVDDEEEQLRTLLQEQSFSNTVLLLGPSQAGKTRLFYQLCHGMENAKTCISLRPNVGFVKQHNASTRFMDYPGHLSLSALPSDVLQSSDARILFLLDATQPVRGGEVFLQLLKQYASSSTKPSILVMCHQSDKAGCKNPKRLRLSLRTEVERLLKISDDDDSKKIGITPGEPLVLEDLADLAFVATSVVTGVGMDTVKAFVEEGKMPEPIATKR